MKELETIFGKLLESSPEAKEKARKIVEEIIDKNRDRTEKSERCQKLTGKDFNIIVY